MRKERLTLRQAQSAWDAIRKCITLAPFKGKETQLPQIDMGEVFNGRKSMTWHAVVEAVRAKVDEAVPT